MKGFSEGNMKNNMHKMLYFFIYFSLTDTKTTVFVLKKKKIHRICIKKKISSFSVNIYSVHLTLIKITCRVRVDTTSRCGSSPAFVGLFTVPPERVPFYLFNAPTCCRNYVKIVKTSGGGGDAR